MTEDKESTISEFEILNRTFDAIEDPIFYLSMDNTIIHANRASELLLQRPLEEIIGSHCYEIVHHTTTNIRGCPFVKAKQTKKRETYTVTIGEHWYQVSIDPIINEEGVMIGAVHILTNIDIIKTVHELRATLGAIIEMTTDPIIGETPDGEITSWNRGAEETLGYSAKEMIGESIMKIIPENLRKEWIQTLQRVQRGERVEHIETRRIKKNGEEIELSLSFTPIPDERGIVQGIAIIGRDLTEIRKAERKLLAYITEAALRIKNPVEFITKNLNEIRELHLSGKINDDDLNTSLIIQIRHAEKVIENIRELQQSIVLNLDEIPKAYHSFLMDEE